MISIFHTTKSSTSLRIHRKMLDLQYTVFLIYLD